MRMLFHIVVIVCADQFLIFNAFLLVTRSESAVAYREVLHLYK